MNLRPFHLLIALAALAACSDGDSTTDESRTSTTVADATTTTAPPATTTTTTAVSATTTAATTTTTVETTTTVPASTIATATDWRLVVETLGQRRQDIYAAPDVTRIPDVCAEDSQCEDDLTVQIADLADKSWRVDGADPYVVLGAEVEGFDGDTLETSVVVTVVAVIERPAEAGAIVDSGGSVVAAVEAETSEGNNAQGRFILVRAGSGDDAWRLISQDTLPEVPA